VCTENISKEGDEDDVQAVLAWGEPVLAAFTREDVHKKMIDLHAAIEDLPLLTLYIPMEFSSAEMTTIGQWCRTQCDQSILLDVHIDAHVVGGCAFVWNDTYHEFSFRSRIKEQAGVITNTLSSYAK
jgi:F0F1-type ATP synthase delta subunit